MHNVKTVIDTTAPARWKGPFNEVAFNALHFIALPRVTCIILDKIAEGAYIFDLIVDAGDLKKTKTDDAVRLMTHPIYDQVFIVTRFPE